MINCLIICFLFTLKLKESFSGAVKSMEDFLPHFFLQTLKIIIPFSSASGQTSYLRAKQFSSRTTRSISLSRAKLQALVKHHLGVLLAKPTGK